MTGYLARWLAENSFTLTEYGDGYYKLVFRTFGTARHRCVEPIFG